VGDRRLAQGFPVTTTLLIVAYAAWTVLIIKVIHYVYRDKP
jgi:hypothetical protein